MDPKFLTESGWKAVATRYKIKDNSLQRALAAACEALKEGKYDEQLKFIVSISQLAAALKKSKEVAAQPDALKYLAAVTDAADEKKVEISKAKVEADKAARVSTTFEVKWSKDFGRWKAALVEGNFSVSATLEGEVEPKGEGTLITQGYTTERGVKEVVKSAEKEFEKTLGSITLKGVEQGSFVHEFTQKGIEISLEVKFTFKTKVSWLSPIFSAQLVIVGAEWEKFKEDPRKFSVVEFKVAGGVHIERGKKIEVNEKVEASVSGELTLGASAQPNWTAILMNVGRPIATNIARGLAGAASGVPIGVFAFVGFSAALLAMSVKSLVEAAEASQLAGLVEATARAVAEGFVAGITEEKQPGDPRAKLGYEVAQKKLPEVRKMFRAKVPQATDADIRVQIKKMVNVEALSKDKELVSKAQQAVWDNFGAKHSGWWSRNIEGGKALRVGFGAIYAVKNGIRKTESDPDFLKYYRP